MPQPAAPMLLHCCWQAAMLLALCGLHADSAVLGPVKHVDVDWGKTMAKHCASSIGRVFHTCSHPRRRVFWEGLSVSALC